MSEWAITVDNRVRLVGAVLAGTSWPAREQARKAHAVHAQGRLTTRFVQDLAGMAAVRLADQMLAEGVPPVELFAAALACRWPTFEPQGELPASFPAAAWVEALADFYVESAIAAFLWADQDAPWQAALAELRAIFRAVPVPAFLSPLAPGPLPQTLAVTPNLTYPALLPLALVAAEGWNLILPPPPAFGHSPPWPYGQDAEWVLATAMEHLVAALLAGVQGPEAALWPHAAATLFLEQALGPAEAAAYLVRSKKQFHLPDLPAAVERLRAGQVVEGPESPRLAPSSPG